MPNIHTALPETQQSIFRPIVLEIVKQVQTITDMKATEIYFPDEDKKIQTSGSGLDSTTNRFVETTSKRFNQIVAEEDIDRDEMSPTFFNGKEYPPFMEDRKLGLAISPVYAKHNVNIAFTYACGSKTEAFRWLQDMRMKISRLKDINTHTVSYHYNLDSRFYDIVKTIHELREKQGAYGETLEEYVLKISQPRITTIGDLTAKTAIFAIAETQTEIYGIFDFDAIPPRPEKDEQSGMWIIGFTYKFNYDKPIGSHMKYPIVVHNQPMPLEFVEFTSEQTRAIAKSPTSSSRTQTALRMFRADCAMDAIKSEEGVIIVPRFDDFSTNVYLKYSVGMLQVLANITPEDKRSLFSLDELGDVVLDSDVLTFLKESEWSYLNKPYRSIFHVDFYQNNVLQNPARLSIDSALNISAVSDLDIRSQYRVRLSIISDTDFLDNAAIQRLRKYPKVAYKVVSAINRAFRENPEMVKLGITQTLSLIQFNSLFRGLLNKEPNYYSTPTIGWDTQNLFKSLGLRPEVLKRITENGKAQRTTMIYGVLAYPKNDISVKEAKAGEIIVPVAAV